MLPVRAGAPALERVGVRLDLPAPPALLLPADLDGDGTLDLVAAIAYTDVESVGIDRIEQAVQITTVVPTFFDRRELHAFLARDGRLVPVGDGWELPEGVIALAPGPGDVPLLALTDDGIAAIAWTGEAAAPFRLEPRIVEPHALSGSRAFLPRLPWALDADGDGDRDLFVPTEDGPAIYAIEDGAIARTAAARLRVPPHASGRILSLAWAEPGDADGDGLPDLAFIVRRDDGQELHLYRGTGGGRFEPQPGGADGTPRPRLEHLRHVLDLDGDGRAEAVTVELDEPEKDGMRAGLRAVRQPVHHVAIHRLLDTGAIADEPVARFDVVGHADLGFEGVDTALFRDLDGDGRSELVTMTLDFSMLQAVRILATRKLGIETVFHVWSQREPLGFREVEGVDLSEKLRLDLDDLRIGRLGHFAGDFDGDGRIDFARLGHGAKIELHLGRPGPSWSPKPDAILELASEPADLGLVEIRDFDGDGRADVAVTTPLAATREGVSPPARLELYLSGTAR